MSIGIKSGCQIGPDISPEIGSPGAGVTPTIWTLEKTGGVNGNWDAEAYTAAIFTGAVEIAFTVKAGVDAYAIGLSEDNPDANYTGIDFAVLNDTGTMYRCANGALTLIGATVAGDEWTIVRAMPGGAVTILKNGVLADTFAGTSTNALRGDSSFRFSGDSVEHVGITHNGDGVAIEWTTDGITATEE